MNATYGLRSSASSASVALQASLASRLPALLDSRGWITFALTWKAQATPLRRQICVLRASAHRTSDSGFTGWPTATVTTGAQLATGRGVNGQTGGLSLGGAATMAAWPTAQSRDGANSRSGMPERTGGRRRNLDDYVTLASWPTPMAGTPAQNGNNAAGNNDSSRKTVALASWATPATRDWKSNEGSPEFHAARAEQARGKPLSEQTHSLPGPPSNGSPAPTAKPGQLNGGFSLWLMGYPVVAWLLAAPSKKPTPRFRRKNPPISLAA
jgi:hypothetical protein